MSGFEPYIVCIIKIEKCIFLDVYHLSYTHIFRFYQRNKLHRLVNAPYTDCSYKWTGGGMLSNVHDLTRYGNIMLYSAQSSDDSQLFHPYLKPSTVKILWTPVSRMSSTSINKYGLGWMIVPENQCDKYAMCRNNTRIVSHTGAAVGSSSVLLLLPRDQGSIARDQSCVTSDSGPHGVVVALLCNMEQVSLFHTALDIAQLFQENTT